MNATTSTTTTPTATSNSVPSHYHILRRLLSLCYNASPQTSYFYAGILFDLYNEELLKGITLPVVVAIDEAARDHEDNHRLHGRQPPKSRSKKGTSSKPSQSSKSPSSSQIHTELVKIPPHLALHIKAWSYLNAQEPYSAIHLVKEHIRPSDSALDRRFHWNNDQGKLDPIPSNLLGSDSESEGGSDGSSDDDDGDDRVKTHLPSTSSSHPKPKTNRTRKSKKKDLDLPCLECAMIYAKGCEVTARFEKGRMVLERTIKTLQKCLDEDEYHKIMSTPPSPLPLNPITPRLQLARLLSTSNTHKLGSLRQQTQPPREEDKENQGAGSRPGFTSGSGSTRIRLEEGTPGRCLEDVLKVDGRGKADGEWCWEAWEEFCELGERWTHPEPPFSEPTLSMPIERFPAHLLPLPASINQSELSHLLNSFSATSLGSTASGGSQYAPSHAGTATAATLTRIPTSTSGQSISDVPSSPPTESSYTSGISPSKGRNTDDTQDRETPRRKMSPLPYKSPLIKAAYAGYPISPPRGGGDGGMFTPVAGGLGSSASGSGMGLFPGGAPERPGKGKGKGMIRAESPPGDISFPDLSFYGTGESRSDTYLLPGVRTPHGTHGHLGRGGAKANHPLPSIASQLFPQAQIKEGSTFGFDETPRTAPAYEPGMGKPPVAKRPRSRAGELRLDEGARNATGRNVSGTGGDHATVRRSARLQENHGAKFQPVLKPLQARSEKQTRAATGAPLAPHKPSNTTDFRPAPPSSPPTSNGGEPPSSPSRSRLGRMETTPAPPRLVRDVFGENQYIADYWLMCLINRCAVAVYAMSKYDCKQAMNLIDTLPNKVQGGAWALGLFGRCFYESAEYEISRNAFIHLRTLEPCRLRDMEWYSTVLWHLDDRAELSRLSQDLMTLDRSCAQTWIATGNSFALQGEHDQAVRCFKRASLVDPGMAYTWTLTAYEALEMEEFDRAISYYQTALRTDVRHYHAWFGLGRVHQKTGKLKMAEYHFRRALDINPSNVVLYCCVGTVMEKRGDLPGALEVFEKALEIDEENKMARFRKARVLMGMERYHDALPILEHLSKVSSTEPSVLFLLGKLYRILGDIPSSTFMLTHARDLNPRLNAVVAGLGLGLDGGEEEHETSMEGKKRRDGTRLRGVMRDE